MAGAVEFEAVSKAYAGKRAVDSLTFAIPEGSLYGFIGPNGSGKTTTLRLMLRILHPDQGAIRVLGRREGQALDDRTGYLPEERGLYRRMRVRDVLCFHANLKGVRDPHSRVQTWLQRLDLADRADARISSLSKGLAQKVQFAAAVVHDPKLLVLDEPFSGLDPVSMEGLRDIILQLKQAGTTVVFSTHDMVMAERLCDAVLMLHRGRKVLDGSVERLKRERGSESIRVRFADDQIELSDPDIVRVRNYGREQVLELRFEAEPQAVLHRLMQRGKLLSFEVVRPSLHELFVDIAGAPAAGTREDSVDV